MLIASRGYEATFLIFGVAQGTVAFVLAFALRPPRPGEVVPVSSPKLRQSLRSFAPREVLASPIFWVLYVMFVAVSASGLTATAEIALIAKSYGIADTSLWLGVSTLTVALIVDNVMNGLARPFFGWVSDVIGREYTMAIAFALGGAADWLWTCSGQAPWPSSCLPASFSSPGVRYSAFSLRLRQTHSARNSRPRTRACFIRRKAHRPFSCPSPISCRMPREAGTACSLPRRSPTLPWVLLAVFVLKPMRSGKFGAPAALTNV